MGLLRPVRNYLAALDIQNMKLHPSRTLKSIFKQHQQQTEKVPFRDIKNEWPDASQVLEKCRMEYIAINKEFEQRAKSSPGSQTTFKTQKKAALSALLDNLFGLTLGSAILSDTGEIHIVKAWQYNSRCIKIVTTQMKDSGAFEDFEMSHDIHHFTNSFYQLYKQKEMAN